MEVFVYRGRRGYLARDMKNTEELAEQLSEYQPLNDDDEITIEITTKWSKIREVLALPFLKDIWKIRKHGAKP